MTQVYPCELGNKKICFVKTHALPFSNYELSKSKRIYVINYGFIYLYRHPLDVLLSSLNYLYITRQKGRFFDRKIMSVDELKNSGLLKLYIQKFTNDLSIGNNSFRSMCEANWLDHVNTWINLHKTGKYLSAVIKYEDMVEDTFESLKPVARLLRKNESDLKDAIENAARETQKDGRFFWKQKLANYQDYFSEEDIEKFIEKYKHPLRLLGYET